MEDEEFWAHVGRLGGVADARSVPGLTAGLGDRVEAFQRPTRSTRSRRP
jgi:hypothetical protein